MFGYLKFYKGVIMPTYDYQCKTCGAVFEYFQSMSAASLEKCPENLCQQETKGHGEVVRKIGGGAGLIFNGSGFYLTDYARKSESGSSKKETKTSPAPTASAEAVV